MHGAHTGEYQEDHILSDHVTGQTSSKISKLSNLSTPRIQEVLDLYSLITMKHTNVTDSHSPFSYTGGPSIPKHVTHVNLGSSH
jgi:hypothetical protein